MKKKIWRIGEYAIGGVIEAQITGKVIEITAKDWNTDEVVRKGSTISDDERVRSHLDYFLNELTSHYYAEKIIDWIDEQVKLSAHF